MNELMQEHDVHLQYCPILKKNVLLSKNKQSGECFTCHHFDECKDQFGDCCNEFMPKEQ